MPKFVAWNPMVEYAASVAWREGAPSRQQGPLTCTAVAGRTSDGTKTAADADCNVESRVVAEDDDMSFCAHDNNALCEMNANAVKSRLRSSSRLAHNGILNWARLVRQGRSGPC